MVATRIAQGIAGVMLLLALPAHADLLICNRMSYVVDTALGVEEKGALTTRGWFRVDPGQCRAVIQGTLEAERIFLHARAHAIYGSSPLPQSGHADLCVAQGNFMIAGRAPVPRGGQRPARFTEVKPTESEKGSIVNLAEEAEYTEEQARDAGIQRLLVARRLRRDARSTASAAPRPTRRWCYSCRTTSCRHLGGALRFLRRAAGGRAEGRSHRPLLVQRHVHTVMAAVGTEEKGAVTTRGWYRVEPGKCMRPEINGQPKRAVLLCRGDRRQRQRRSSAATSRWRGAATPCCARATSNSSSPISQLRGQGSDLGRLRCDRARRPRRHGAVQVNRYAVKCNDERRPRRAASAMSRPGCSISTTRSIRITSISGIRWTSASATTSRISST